MDVKIHTHATKAYLSYSQMTNGQQMEAFLAVSLEHYPNQYMSTAATVMIDYSNIFCGLFL